LSSLDKFFCMGRFPNMRRIYIVRFYINILTTYYPDLDPPYDTYHQQILEQIELAEELMAAFHG
jgi:hypothetical protein